MSDPPYVIIYFVVILLFESFHPKSVLFEYFSLFFNITMYISCTYKFN
jgi:hypothetical protein